MSRKSNFFAWGMCAAVIVASLINFTLGLAAEDPATSLLKRGGDAMWNLLAFEFGVLAAVILWRQPGQRIGWLFMVFAASAIPSALLNTTRFRVPAAAPASPSPVLLISLWYDGWSWVPPIFAILLLPLLFPTGWPHSPRWRWVLVYALILVALFLALMTFRDTLNPSSGEASWSVKNPIGFIPNQGLNSGLFLGLWFANLCVLTLSSFAALVSRYRHSGERARRQIKLLLYACGVFAAIYVSAFPLTQVRDSFLDDLWPLLFAAGMAAIPIVIAVSILRYRLFDIDLIVRRTLVYGIVTAVLAFVFYGVVLVLQRTFTSLSGEQSPVAIVASTLAIATLFTPLRRRVQDFVDRRFYRRKYDAQQVLAQFAIVARDETDVERLTAGLEGAVEETMRPSAIGVWLTPAATGVRK